MDEYTKDLYTMMFSLQTLQRKHHGIQILCGKSLLWSFLSFSDIQLSNSRELQSEKLYIKVWTNYCYGIKNLKTVNISN